MFKDILTVYGKGSWPRQKCQDYIADSTTDPPTTCTYDFLVKRDIVADDDFETLLTSAADKLSANVQYRKVVRRRVDNRPLGTPSLYAPARTEFDAIIESWVTDSKSIAEIREIVRAAYVPFVDDTRSSSVITTETVVFNASRANAGHTD
ncbi:hypothetical protein OG563_47285 [Nocardia vinacea]|uniref:Uncharacterized protein n=1 Tax=Nocardia vinacea TaxID=96468 RepID=A0ABZ1YWB5_9NOCA|nr:hypothetical protein [Nocardia vinacea]